MKRPAKCWMLVLWLLGLALMLSACGHSAQQASSEVASVPTWQEQYDLGIRYLSEGNYREAILAFEMAIEIDPKRPETYIGLADAYIGTGAFDFAVKVLENGFSATQDKLIQEQLNKIRELQYFEPEQGITYLNREERVRIMHEKYEFYNDDLLGGYADYDGDGFDESEFFDTYHVEFPDGWKIKKASFYYCDHDGQFAESLAEFEYSADDLNYSGSGAKFNEEGFADYFYCFVGTGRDQSSWNLYHLGVFGFNKEGFPELIYEDQDIELTFSSGTTGNDEIEQYIEGVLSLH